MSKVQKTASAQPCTCAPVGTAPPKRQGGAGRREEMSRGAAPSLRMPRAQTPAPDSDTQELHVGLVPDCDRKLTNGMSDSQATCKGQFAS